MEHGTGNLIPNYHYFIINPVHGNNGTNNISGNGNSGTCGPVAAQILLGYHNYYNDRRIVPDNMLNGYDDSSNSVVFTERNPNYCIDPMTMTPWTIGTRSEDTGDNSFYSKLVTTIMEPNTSGTTIWEVKNGMTTYLNERLNSLDFSIQYRTEILSYVGWVSIDPSYIKSEIDSGRPIIISMEENLGGADHFVVGYGYCDYTYPDDGDTYSGYIVHFGWNRTNANCVWVNSAWCNGYISLKINHTHDYYTNGQIPSTGKMEYKCIECGHRTDAAINMLRNDKYMERQANITINSASYKDYYVTFKTAGNKMFQTFGLENTKMELYDTEYQCLISDDDSGYNLNAMFNYTVEANKPYILRVGFANSSTYGNIKIGITPASLAYLNYDYIMSSGGNNTLFEINSTPNATTILTFKPSVSGTYTFRTGYQGTSQVDTYLYLIDPDGTVPYKFDDDSAGDLQAFITMNLIAYKPYFIIISPKTLSAARCELFLSINKLNT